MTKKTVVKKAAKEINEQVSSISQNYEDLHRGLLETTILMKSLNIGLQLAKDTSEASLKAQRTLNELTETALGLVYGKK